MLTALKNREYRYLWGGQAISHLGDQFHLVALPWLVLAVTHDPLQLGLVLAAAGLVLALGLFPLARSRGAHGAVSLSKG